MSAPMAPQEVPTLKILLVGTSSVGKSSLLLRYTDDEYVGAEEATATIGVDYKVKSIVVGGKRYKLSIWDTAGQERFRTLTSSYYRGAHGVIVTYDVTNRESFDALPTWFNELDTFTTNKDVVKIVVGNKTDKEYSRAVTTDEGRSFAESKGCLFVECSAKKGEGVNGAFDELVNKIISTPSLWQNTVGTRPGDRMPGGAPADHAATSSRGNISLGDPTGTQSSEQGEIGTMTTAATTNSTSTNKRSFDMADLSAGGDESGLHSAEGGAEGGTTATAALASEAEEFLDPSLLHEATLPISNISRLMKKALPAQAKVSSSAKDLIQACCIEFISFLTSEANEKCLLEKRKTINGDDILFAMKLLGFDDFEVVCRIWLSRYRMALEMSNRLKEKEKERESGGGGGGGAGGGSGGMSARGQSTSKQSTSTAGSVGSADASVE